MKRINQIEPWLGQEEKEELISVIESGWFTEAQKTREFERVFAEYVGSKHAVAVNNGTVSLFIACMALGIGVGDEVIVPDLTMIASPNSVRLAGAEPVMVDIDPKTLCIDMAASEAAITERTKAIMPVAFNGRYPDMDALLGLAHKHNLYIIEDAAQALGSRSRGKHLGTFGEIGSFSFSTPKVITTGQGGMLVTDDIFLYEKMMKIKDFGRRQKSEDIHVMMGYNFKFTEFQAAVGLAQMKKLEWRVQRKKDMFKLYQKLLSDVPQARFVETDLEDTSPWFIDVLLEGMDREALARALQDHGVGTRPFYPPIHTQAPYAGVKGQFPVCDDVCPRGLWLPSSVFLGDDDIGRVCDEIRGAVRLFPSLLEREGWGEVAWQAGLHPHLCALPSREWKRPDSSRLRIVMLSDYQSRMDEGVNNIAAHMMEHVGGVHEIRHECLRPYRRLLRPGFWNSVRRVRPDIIHFVPGPTLKSFLLVKALQMVCPKAKTVMSAAHPAFSRRWKSLIRRLAPDLILVQSPESRRMFAEMGFRTWFVPGGVDTDRFLPVTQEAKRQLRMRYGLPPDEFVVLHVGPLKRGRNLLAFRALVEKGVTVLVVGSLTVPSESDVKQELLDSGCTVWHRYFENISEVYGLADCYVFPTLDRDHCVETPLSVLEAMSCNLPVVSTPFRALPHMFQEGDGLIFCRDEAAMLQALRGIRSGSVPCNTRAKVSEYTWDKVGEAIERAYREVVA